MSTRNFVGIEVAPDADSSSRASRRISTSFAELSQRLSRPRTVCHADELADFVHEGDIFLFKGKQVHDRLIRCCTASEYNHVAMAIFFEGELQLLEATQQGVGCCPLEFYINSMHWVSCNERFHKITIRRLQLAQGSGSRGRLTAEMHMRLIRFKLEMDGRAFERNPLEYVRPLLAIKQREDFSSLFCSELARHRRPEPKPSTGSDATIRSRYLPLTRACASPAELAGGRRVQAAGPAPGGAQRQRLPAQRLCRPRHAAADWRRNALAGDPDRLQPLLAVQPARRRAAGRWAACQPAICPSLRDDGAGASGGHRGG